MKADPALKKYYYLNKGKQKIKKEFDVVEILRSIRQLRVMRDIFMNEHQRVLFRYQKENLLDSNSESSQNDDEFIDSYEVQKCKEKNEFVKTYVNDIVKDCLVQLDRKVENLSPLDERLIAGLFFKQITSEQLVRHLKNDAVKDNHDSFIENANNRQLIYKQTYQTSPMN